MSRSLHTPITSSFISAVAYTARPPFLKDQDTLPYSSALFIQPFGTLVRGSITDEVRL